MDETCCGRPDDIIGPVVRSHREYNCRCPCHRPDRYWTDKEFEFMKQHGWTEKNERKT